MEAIWYSVSAIWYSVNEGGWKLGRSQTFSFGGPLEGPVLQQGELSVVCVGLQCSGMTSSGKFWGWHWEDRIFGGQWQNFWGAVAPLALPSSAPGWKQYGTLSVPLHVPIRLE